MGQSALTSPLDTLAATAAPVVRARRGATWDEGGPEFGDELRALAAGLASYGLASGSSAAVLGRDGCDRLLAELAVLTAGASLISIDPALADETLAAALSDAAAIQAIACDESDLARLLRVRPDLPALELLLLMRAAPSERKPAALQAGAAMQAGAGALERDPAMLSRALETSGAPATIRLIGKGGGDRAIPREALMRLADRLGAAVGVEAGRVTLVALPAAGPARLAVALAAAECGATLLLADPEGSPDAGVAELAPGVVLLSSDSLERLHSAWTSDVAGRSWMRRAMARWSIRQGASAERGTWKHRLAESLVLGELRARLGGKVRALHVLSSGSSPAASEAISFFEAVGLQVKRLRLDQDAQSGLSLAAF